MRTEQLVLDDVQERVVDHDGGPLLVLGSPGTGKTTVLVERWVRLATDVVEPHRVLLLVPTRDRALALRDELPFRLAQQAVLEVPVHTWHALAYHLVTRYYRMPRLLAAADPADERRADVGRPRAAHRRAQARWGATTTILDADAFVAEVADFCVRAGHRGLDDDALDRWRADRPEHAPVANFALRYRQHLREAGGARLRGARPRGDASARSGRRHPHGRPTPVHARARRRRAGARTRAAAAAAPAQHRAARVRRRSRLGHRGVPRRRPDVARSLRGGVAPTHERVVLDHAVTATASHRRRSDVAHRARPRRRLAIARRRSSGPRTVRPSSASTRRWPASSKLSRARSGARTWWSRSRSTTWRSCSLNPSPTASRVERVLRTFEIPCHAVSADGLRTQPAVRAVLDLCKLALLDERSDELCKAVMCSPMFGFHPVPRARARPGSTDATRDDAGGAHRRIDGRRRRRASPRARRGVASTPTSRPTPRSLASSRHRRGAEQMRSRALRRRRGRRSHQRARARSARRSPTSSSDSPARRCATTSKRRPSRVRGRDVARPDGRDQRRSRLLSFHGAKGHEWDVVCVLGVAEGQIPKAHRAQGLFDPWALERGGAIDRAQAQLAEERRTLYVALTRARRRLLVTTSPGCSQGDAVALLRGGVRRPARTHHRRAPTNHRSRWPRPPRVTAGRSRDPESTRRREGSGHRRARAHRADAPPSTRPRGGGAASGRREPSCTRRASSRRRTRASAATTSVRCDTSSSRCSASTRRRRSR